MIDTPAVGLTLPEERASLSRRALDWLHRFALVIVGIAMAGEIVVTAVTVFTRKFFDYSPTWVSDFATVSLAIMGFVGGAVAIPSGKHLSVDIVLRRLPDRVRLGVESGRDAAILAAGGLLLVAALMLVRSSWNDHSPTTGLPQPVMLAPLILGAFMAAVFAFGNLAALGRIFGSIGLGVIAAAAIVLIGGLVIMGPPADVSTVGLILGVVSIILLASGVPIAFTLILVSMLFAVLANGVLGTVNISVVAINMDATMGHYVLLALPFFTFAGLIMAYSGTTDPLMRVIFRLLGRFHGGPLHVVVVSMYIFSGISGSKAADMVAIGSSVSNTLEKSGYSKHEIAAVLAASGAMGETIPPSTVLLVLGSITSLSVIDLFEAGIIPAAVLAVCLMAAIYVSARRGAQKGIRRASLEITTPLWQDLLGSIPPLVVPGILVVGIVGAFGTPTEISAFAVICALIITAAYHGRDSIAVIVRAFRDSVALFGMILLAISAAGALAWSLAIQQIPQDVANAVAALHGQTWLFMTCSIAILLALGLVLEGVPALIIAAPLLLPAAAEAGISELQFGIVLVLAMGIGTFIPPVGIGAFVAASVTGAGIREVTPLLSLYLAILMIGVALIAAFPVITLALPALLNR